MYEFLDATLFSAVVDDVPNNAFTPDAVHCAKVLKHWGILPWNKTLVVHSSKFVPQTSVPFKQAVYASIHSALSNRFDVVVVDPDVT